MLIYDLISKKFYLDYFFLYLRRYLVLNFQIKRECRENRQQFPLL